MNHNNCRITVPEIPVFFSTDDNYIPFLDVALSSLIENASRDYRYRIMILNTGLSAENMARILEREQAGFAIEFVDISDRLEGIMAHFGVAHIFIRGQANGSTVCLQVSMGASSQQIVQSGGLSNHNSITAAAVTLADAVHDYQNNGFFHNKVPPKASYSHSFS